MRWARPRSRLPRSSLYAGAMYGGSTMAILLNVPGETSAVVTCLDGHAMAQQCRAGSALSIAAIGSYIAGTLGVVGLMLFAPLIAGVAPSFGPPEYFALMAFGSPHQRRNQTRLIEGGPKCRSTRSRTWRGSAKA
jgi:TctA family transporter